METLQSRKSKKQGNTSNSGVLCQGSGKWGRTGNLPIDPLRITSEHYLGANSELLAAAYFVRQGWQVYWPTVQQSCIDFVIEKSREFKRVQVKTASWNKGQQYKYLQCRTVSTNKYPHAPSDSLYDLFVIVHEESIWVIPAVDIKSTNLSLLANTKRNKGRNKWDHYKNPLLGISSESGC